MDTSQLKDNDNMASVGTLAGGRGTTTASSSVETKEPQQPSSLQKKARRKSSRLTSPCLSPRDEPDNFEETMRKLEESLNQVKTALATDHNEFQQSLAIIQTEVQKSATE